MLRKLVHEVRNVQNGRKSYLSREIVFSVLFLLLANIVFTYFAVRPVHAAALSEASVQLYRMGASVTASSSDPILVVIKIPNGAADTEDEIRLTIPDDTANGFTVDGTASNITTTTTGIPSTYQGESLTAMPSLASQANAVNDTGNSTDVDIVIGNITDTNLYGFFITGGITNPDTADAGTFVWTLATLASNSVIDSKDVAVDTVTTDADQVTVSATVPATFNFNIQDTALDLGTLSTGAVANNAMSSPIDIDTNAGNGWIAWIRSEGGAATLASASTGDELSSTDTGSPVTLSAGTEGYVVDVSGSQGGNSSGTLTIATEYDGNGTTSGGVLDTDYEQIAQSTGQAEDDQLTLTAIAAISAVTAAADDYTDTWEVVGAGNF